ncbi:MAG: hypothetical protein IKL04_04670 [Lachnospiraceae bacterium]|nr:hypothetical protein [Lachnospiraceae bacterium]
MSNLYIQQEFLALQEKLNSMRQSKVFQERALEQMEFKMKNLPRQRADRKRIVMAELPVLVLLGIFILVMAIVSIIELFLLISGSAQKNGIVAISFLLLAPGAVIGGVNWFLKFREWTVKLQGYANMTTEEYELAEKIYKERTRMEVINREIWELEKEIRELQKLK